jgi:hypothetical protein
MIRRISFRFAVNAMLLLLAWLAMLHVLVLTGMVSFNIVWGGRLDDPSSMRLFELVSLLVILLMMLIIAIRGRLIKFNISGYIINPALWVMAAYFLLNTLGNVLSLNTIEAMIFTPLSFLAAVFCYRLVIE